MTAITQQELRSLCQEQHTLAEHTIVAQGLIDGTINPQTYKNLCYQLYFITDAIESRGITQFEFSQQRDLYRKDKFVQDLAECPSGPVVLCNSTKTYLEYLQSLSALLLKGHIYVHYMGLLYGGQLIAKKLNLPTNHLKFENVKSTVDYVRQNILNDLSSEDGAEAVTAFKNIIAIYEELVQ